MKFLFRLGAAAYLLAAMSARAETVWEHVGPTPPRTVFDQDEAGCLAVGAAAAPLERDLEQAIDRATSYGACMALRGWLPAGYVSAGQPA